MRTFTTEHTVYTFDKLSDEAKQKAIDRYREGNDYPFLEEDMQYRLEELLKEYKITYDELPKVYYSLSHCQGDGAMFEGTVYWKSWRVDIKQSGHYSHYNSKTFYGFESVKTDKEAPQETQDAFNDIYIEICKKLERYGYDVIEAENNDDNIAENIRANDYEFYEDGRMA